MGEKAADECNKHKKARSGTTRGRKWSDASIGLVSRRDSNDVSITDPSATLLKYNNPLDSTYSHHSTHLELAASFLHCYNGAIYCELCSCSGVVYREVVCLQTFKL
jgi:hypothetical protein